jgi:hypothetical protein
MSIINQHNMTKNELKLCYNQEVNTSALLESRRTKTDAKNHITSLATLLRKGLEPFPSRLEGFYVSGLRDLVKRAVALDVEPQKQCATWHVYT